MEGKRSRRGRGGGAWGNPPPSSGGRPSRSLHPASRAVNHPSGSGSHSSRCGNPAPKPPSAQQPAVPERFVTASETMQASVKKHAQYESSSDEGELEEDKILVSVMEKYNEGKKDLSLAKTREFLEQSFQSGAAVCLICIATVKRVQPIWSCNTCFTAFHLDCIQSWAASSLSQQSESDDPPVSEFPVRVKPTKKPEWCCPKCRNPYNPEDVPVIYQCFCQKVTDPKFQPWLIPHSCGEICDKPLASNCGHRCLLLCHPGACPPCPKTVRVQCYCNRSEPKLIRCNNTKWSCNRRCNAELSCNLHRCEDICHPYQCKPCFRGSLQPCRCGKLQSIRPCTAPDWQCNLICDRIYPCGYHTCQKICHKGECGQCPYSGLQTCPCGRVKGLVDCPMEIGTCGGTCNKLLPCKVHRCVSKCHRGNCPPCVEVINKFCRCGTNTKEHPCNKQYLCDTRCRIIKECGRHNCSKKCCDGNCLPCDKICGRTLQCKKHKCQNICHDGLCFPCQLTVNVSCRCGETYYSVPCGIERKTKPPKCLKNCKIPRSCDHIKENVHKCHYNACPQCKELCGNLLSCGHKCMKTCHTAEPFLIRAPKPSGPWEVQPPKIEIRSVPCPPCKVPVNKPCLGYHEEGFFPCHEARISSCGRKCGMPLPCGNHSCTRECHPLIPIHDDTNDKHKCEVCDKPCELSRPAGCKHPCKKGCHPAPCPPCQQFFKRQCHCGIRELYIRCHNMTNPNGKDDVLSCKEQCSRTLGCKHRCSAICHSGPCPSTCPKKTKAYCPCRRIKRDVLCKLAKSISIQCDQACKDKLKHQMELKEEEERRRKMKEDEKNRREVAEYEKKFGERKYRKSKSRNSQVLIQPQSFYAQHRYLFISMFMFAMSISAYLIFRQQDVDPKLDPKYDL